MSKVYNKKKENEHKLKALEIIKEMFNDKVDITELLTYVELDIRANRKYEESPFKQFFKKEKYELLKEVIYE